MYYTKNRGFENEGLEVEIFFSHGFRWWVYRMFGGFGRVLIADFTGYTDFFLPQRRKVYTK